MTSPLTRTAMASAWLVFVASTGLAAEGPMSSRGLDSQIDRAIYQSILTGVPLFNSGDHAGCFRIYQGTLIGVEPFLSYRPELQTEVANALKQAQSAPSFTQGAFNLRKVLDKILTEVRAGPPAPSMKSLWARLGGEPAVKAVVHDFVGLAATDPNVDFFRGGKYQLDAEAVANLESLLIEFISSATGGPLQYEGRPMKPAHAGMGITDNQFNALAGDLIAVLKKYKVPQKEIDELVAIVATTRKDIVESPSTTPEPKSLWSRLGGEPAVKAVVHDFVGLAASDPNVDFFRGGKYPLDAAGVARLEQLLVEFISSATGGPLQYEGRPMKPAHAGMGITDNQFNALAGDLIAVLKKYKVPQKEIDELISIVATTRKDIVEINK
jgi:hemoglobin